MKLHLFGDSVLKGAVTEISGDPAPSLDSIRSPSAIMNLAAGREIARFAGITGIPKNASFAAAEMAKVFASGQIAPGDAVVFLDVGPHAMDTASHEADWLLLRRTATATHPVRLIMCGGFDDGAMGRRDLQHEAPLDGRSPNDAVRAAATASGSFRGETRFLDLAAPLRRAKQAMARRTPHSPYFRDGVHLSVWGQICVSLLILRTLGVPMPGLGRLSQAISGALRHLEAISELRALETLNTAAAAAGVRSAALELPRLRAKLTRTGREEKGAYVPDPQALALAQCGDELMRSKAFEDALPVFRQALALDPHCRAAHRGRTHAAALTGRHDEVIAASRAALALAPGESKYYVWLSEAILAAGADPDLVEWLDQTAEAHAPPRAFQAMATLTRALGDPERARIWSERAAFGG
jgi:tetratricopeptide (TPR) repeat protein